MIRYIVDTHTLIWYLTSDRRLGETVQILTKDNEIILSKLITATWD